MGLKSSLSPAQSWGGRWRGPPSPADRAAPAFSPARRAQSSKKLQWDLTERRGGYKWDLLEGPWVGLVPSIRGGRPGITETVCWERNGVIRDDNPSKYAAGLPGVQGWMGPLASPELKPHRSTSAFPRQPRSSHLSFEEGTGAPGKLPTGS